MIPKRGTQPPTVPKVNLLDPNVEPTDAEFEALMLAMARGVRKKSAKLKRARNAALGRTLGRRS